MVREFNIICYSYNHVIGKNKTHLTSGVKNYLMWDKTKNLMKIQQRDIFSPATIIQRSLESKLLQKNIADSLVWHYKGYYLLKSTPFLSSYLPLSQQPGVEANRGGTGTRTQQIVSSLRALHGKACHRSWKDVPPYFQVCRSHVDLIAFLRAFSLQFALSSLAPRKVWRLFEGSLKRTVFFCVMIASAGHTWSQDSFTGFTSGERDLAISSLFR